MVRGDNPGRRDIKIVVERSTQSRNSTTGEPVDSWSTFATVYGSEMRPPSSTEAYESDQQVAISTRRYKIPYLAGLNERMRFSIVGEYFYVKGIELWDRRKFMVVSVEARDNV